jgi:hypothetical protein
MSKEKKNVDPKIDGASIITDTRFTALHGSNEKDLLANAKAAKKYIKGATK